MPGMISSEVPGTAAVRRIAIRRPPPRPGSPITSWVESSPSTLSALRLLTLTDESTVIGAPLECSSSAGPPPMLFAIIAPPVPFESAPTPCASPPPSAVPLTPTPPLAVPFP